MMEEPRPVPDPSAASYGSDRYLTRPKRSRRGIALCLSGGGYRAVLFHLGAVRRLNELNILGKLRTVTSVSGGSILSAFLASRLTWPIHSSLSTSEWDDKIAGPVRAFTGKNIRTPSLIKGALPFTDAVDKLADYYTGITSARLQDLPDHPRFIFCATNMTFGVSWTFTRDRLGDYQTGYAASENWPVARAVAASSCFPPIFNPLRVHLKPEQFRRGKYKHKNRDELLSDIRITDGGNYDNLGLEPVWKSHESILVSDGGSSFDFGADMGLIWRFRRYVSILENQAHALRKRWLIAGYLLDQLEGAYWGINSSVSAYDLPSHVRYSEELIAEMIAEVRTDLDSFSDAEACILENHGYLLADAAIQRHVPRMITSVVQPLRVPHPDWMDEQKVRGALQKSHRIKIFGRW